MSALNENLKNAFEQHRVVFWYDATGESREQYDEIQLAKVEKIEVNHNAFALKYKILRQEKSKKFLLYFPYERPANEDNWLLDIELSHFVFDTEQSALYLQEMGLDYTYKNLVKDHLHFFGAKDRRKQFVELFNKTDSAANLKYKMLSVVFATDNYDLQTLVQAYANSYFSNWEKLTRDLERYNLKEFLWKEIREKYKYQNDKQNIYEFVIEIFENSFPLTKKSGLTADARLVLSSWRDSYTMRDSYRRISSEIAGILKIEDLLQDAPLDEIIEDELFELTDQKIIYELVHHLLNQDISEDRFHKIIKARESTFWFSTYEHLYRALENAFSLFQIIEKTEYDYQTVEKAIDGYVKEDFKIDFYYRKFYEHFHQAEKQNIIKHLIEQVEKIYVNEWLFTGGNTYQKLLNDKTEWHFNQVLMQNDFFQKKVKPIIKRQKLVVIISDALRYECGSELADEINQISKFNAKIEPMISMIPSYTQLGMASLLPHQKLSFDGTSDRIIADGIPTSGTENREKILKTYTKGSAKTMLAREFTHLKTTERRELIRDHEIIYLYSNKIDQAGDDKMTENEVFKAVKAEIEHLKELVVAATSANASRILVTADHGFIYQDSAVEESDFIETKFKGDTFKVNRRFVLGSKLIDDERTLHFAAKDLKIDSPADVLIAKGINRFKVRGAGSRFVHGGASLQETLIPILDISKGREETVRHVDIDIIQSHNRITTNSLPVEFIQKEPVSEKILSIEIKAFIQAKDGKILSDIFSFIFDFKGKEHRQRSKQFTFHMSSEAGQSYRNQTVDLILQTPIPGTSRWRDLKKFSYQLNISFTTDFD